MELQDFFTNIIMTELKKLLILISSIIAIGEAGKINSNSTKCPPCDLQLNETYHETGLRILNGKGPEDGSCDFDEQDYKFFGKKFGLSHDACCCSKIVQTSPVQCSPRDPAVPDCPKNLYIKKHETVGHYFRRVGKCQKGAPPNGCCPAGTYKYIFTPEMTGNDENICACFVFNKAHLDDDEAM